MSGFRKGDLPRIERKLRELPQAVQVELRQKIAAAGSRVLAEAQSRVPVDQGELKQGITLLAKGPFGWAIDVFAAARSGRHRFNYAWFVEFGVNRPVWVTLVRKGRLPAHRRRSRHLGKGAQPFLVPAFRQVMRPVLREIRAAIRGVIAKKSSRG